MRLPGPFLEPFRRRWLVAVSVNLVLFAGAYLLLTPRYDTNDDPIMMAIASGQISGQPSEYLVFSNVLIGKVLKGLYSLAPTLNWYTAYIYSVHFLAACLVLASLLRSRRRVAALLLYLVLFLGIHLSLLLRPQFTSTATVAAAAGLFGLLAATLCPGGRLRSRHLLAVFLLTLAAMIRFHAFLLTGIVCAPAALMLLGRRNIYSFLRWSAIAALLVVAVGQIDRLSYQADPAWRDFRELRRLRTTIDLSPVRFALASPEEHLPALRSIGWSANDAVMYRSWFYADEETFSHAKLERLYQELRHTPIATGGVRQVLARFYSEKTLLAMTLGLLLLLCLPFSRLSPRVLAFVGGQVLVVSALCVYLEFYFRLPSRVLLSIFYTANLAIVFVYVFRRPPGAARTAPGRAVTWIFVLGFAALIGRHLESLGDDSSLHRRQQMVFRQACEAMSELRTRDRRPLAFVLWGGAFPYEWMMPFSTDTDWRRLRALPLGWINNSPLHQRARERFGIQDIPRDLYLRDDVLLVCNETGLAVFETFVREHYGDEVSFQRVGEGIEQGLFGIYKAMPGKGETPHEALGEGS